MTVDNSGKPLAAGSRPKRLNKNPLIEVTGEIRFSRAVPADAVLGLVYSQVRDSFSDPKGQPILQVPSQLREADPQLKYAVTHRFKSKDHPLSLGLGPQVLGITAKEYVDWDSSLRPQLEQLLDRVAESGLFDVIERIGLRYINFFPGQNILQRSTVSLSIAGQSVAMEKVITRVERSASPFIVIDNIANSAKVEGHDLIGSVLDIDIVHPAVNLRPSKDLSKQLMNLFHEANTRADDEFFGLLLPNFVVTFDPEY